MSIIYIIIIIFSFFQINSNFEPNITFIKTIDKHLSLPYYARFNQKPDKSCQYSLWISNNPYCSLLSSCGYIAQFKYNPDNLDFLFIKKISTPDVLGLAPCLSCKEDDVYPGIQSYPAVSLNNKYILEASLKERYPLYNICSLKCQEEKIINSYILGGKPANLEFALFKYFNLGVQYQLAAVAYNIKNTITDEITGNVSIFNYALNKSILNQPLTPLTTITTNIDIPSDVQISSFADIDGNYLLAVSNSNSPYISLFKINILNPASITVTYFTNIQIENYQQYFLSFSRNRYLAVNIIDTSVNNLYLYYFDEKFNITQLNNGKPYNTGILPQALTWSPDSKILVIPNYLNNNITLYQANISDIKVKLTPKVQAQYENKSSVITAQVSGGVPPYTFYFSDGTSVTQESDIYSITVSPTITTVYNVTVVDSENNITGFANPVTVQISKPVISKIIPNCKEDLINIYGKILDPLGNVVIYSTAELYISDDVSLSVVSNKCGNFKTKYNLDKD